MSRRIDHLEHRFVRFIPDELENGVLYVSIEYKTVTHRCCCGCGEKVVTPLSPAGWALTFNGRNISLLPSIAGGTCNSHYFIRHSGVQWVRPLRTPEAAAALLRDQAAAERLYGASSGMDTSEDAAGDVLAQSGSWLRRLWRRVGGGSAPTA